MQNKNRFPLIKKCPEEAVDIQSKCISVSAMVQQGAYERRDPGATNVNKTFSHHKSMKK